MAVSTGYDYGVKQGLISKGVDPSQIGYDPSRKTVTVGGADFMRPDKVYNGSSYTNQMNFNNAWDAYSKPKPMAAGAAAAGVYPSSPVGMSAGIQAGNAYSGTPTSAPTSAASSPSYGGYTNPYDTQYNDLLKTLMQQAQQPQQVDINAIMASPQYAALQAQQQRAAHDATRAAQESLGASGFGRSSALAERAQGIQNDANQYLMTQALPALVQQEQQRRAQQLQNQFSILDALQHQQGIYDTRHQNDISNALQQGQLTGTYLPPEMSGLYNRVLQDKQAYGAATTPEERQRLAADAEAARSQIAMLGGNAGLVGADVTYGQAAGNMPQFGVQTEAARQFNADQAYRQQQLAEQQRQFDEQQQYQAARDAIGDKHWQAQFDQDVKQAGLNYALQKLSQENDQAYRQATLALSQQDNALARDKFNYQQQQDAQTQQTTPPISAKDSSDNYNSIVDDLSTSKNVDKPTALKLLQANRDYLSDSDYRKLSDWINNNF